MESNLWIELAESMLEILRRIVELENDEQTQVSDEMVICLDCGCNAKECVCY